MTTPFLDRCVSLDTAANLVGGARKLRRLIASGVIQLSEGQRVRGVIRRRVALRELALFAPVSPERVAAAEALCSREHTRQAAYPSRRKHGGPYQPQPHRGE